MLIYLCRMKRHKNDVKFWNKYIYKNYTKKYKQIYAGKLSYLIIKQFG